MEVRMEVRCYQIGSIPALYCNKYRPPARLFPSTVRTNPCEVRRRPE